MQPQRLCGKFDRCQNAQTRDEVEQADLCVYVHIGHMRSLFIRISPRVHITDIIPKNAKLCTLT